MENATTNAKLIETFYLAFAQKDFKTMAACYHKDVEFEDPAFGKLKAEEASKMWEMLLTRSKDLTITFANIHATETSGSANWLATYTFSRTGNKVINRVEASFEFKDDRIVKHTDTFDLHTWFVNAFGWKGYLFSTLPFLKNKFKQQAKQTLTNFISKST